MTRLFLDNILQANLDVLEEIASLVKDAEVRARITDVLWVKRRHYAMAEMAIDAYLESAARLEDPEHWPACTRRIERATRIAVSLGAQSKGFAQVFAHIETILEKYKGEDPLFLSAKMMHLLLEFNRGDVFKCATLAEKAATRAENKNAWLRARTYWELKARCHKVLSNVRLNKSLSRK